MNLKNLILLTGLAFSCFLAMAQDKVPVKFGKVSPEDFAPKVYSVDSNANSVVIADVGSSEIIGNSKSSFSLQFKRYTRIRILNKNGYDDANVEIDLHSEGDAEEELSDVKAVTYNLENGKVVETKLDKGAIFKDKVDKNNIVKKFTLPNIKEGCIIEYQYTIQSDFLFNLQPWAFQGGTPVLWSEYNLRLPEFLGYVFISQGYLRPEPYPKKESTTRFTVRDTRSASATETSSFDANVTDYRWVLKNVPALKYESYTSTLRNHITKIEFQLSDIRPPLTPRNVMGTWTKLSYDLLHDESFGDGLDRNNGWLGDVVTPLIAGAKDDMEKAKRIYAYVRDNYTCTDHNSKYLDQSLKNVLKSRNGNVASINLLLTAMLKYANIHVDPVILSTREHGYTSSIYPLISKFNYVIAMVNAGGKNFFLDASEPRMGFGKLDFDCYNGHARIINEEATPLELSSDSLLEKKITSVIIASNAKGEMEGTEQQVPGYYESHTIRDRVKEKGKDDYFQSIKKGFGQDIDISNAKIDSLDALEENVQVSYDFKLNGPKEDILYINPMFGEAWKENPFKSAERFYPVEMPYALDETYVFSFVIPDGYVLDELPKSARVKLNQEDDGEFEYLVSESGGTISLRSRVKLKRAYYLPEEYEILREFFNLIVKKHSEQIVLKKKK